MSIQRFPRMRIARDLVRLEDEVGLWVATYWHRSHLADDPWMEGRFSDRAVELEELERRIHECADWATGMNPMRRRNVVS